MEGENKLLLKGRETTASKQGESYFSASVSCSLSAQTITGITAFLRHWHGSIAAETHHLTGITVLIS